MFNLHTFAGGGVLAAPVDAKVTTALNYEAPSVPVSSFTVLLEISKIVRVDSIVTATTENRKIKSFIGLH